MKKITINLSLLLLGFCAYSQPALQSSGLTPGASFDLYSLNNVVAGDLVATGANVTWNISTSTATVAGSAKFESMAGNPNAATYPDANFAIKLTTGTQVSYSLFRLTSTIFEEVANNVGTTSETGFTNYRTSLVFPYTYSTNNTDNYQKTGQQAKVITHNYEAYGALTTSISNDANLVREVINDDGNTMYMWWNAAPVHPVLQGSSSGFILWKPTPNSVSEISKKNTFHIYPNPAVNNISIVNEQPIRKLELYNVTGQILLTTDKSVISLENFSSGIYYLKAYLIDGVETQQFLKQ